SSPTPSKTPAVPMLNCSVTSVAPALTSGAAGLWTSYLGRGDAVTEQDWLASTDPRAMLVLARRCGRESERTLRLFTVACCRRLGPLFADAGAGEASEAAERYADGLAGAEELEEASRQARTASDRLLAAGQIRSVLAFVAHLASHRHEG